METNAYRGPVEVIDAETGTHTTDAIAVLESRVDGRPGCWGIVTGHSAGDLPPHLRLIFVDGSEVTVLIDWQDRSGTARVRGGPLPATLAASA